MQFMVTIQASEALLQGEPPADLAATLEKEQAEGRAQYARGDLRQSWEIDDRRSGAVCLYEASSRDALHAMIDAYPSIRTGYAGYQVVQLKPDTAYTAGA